MSIFSAVILTEAGVWQECFSMTGYLRVMLTEGKTIKTFIRAQYEMMDDRPPKCQQKIDRNCGVVPLMCT